MAFIDDLRGLSRAEQIARVQGVAREHGDELTELQADQALSLNATQVADDPAVAFGRHKITDRHGELYAGYLPNWLSPHMAVWPDRGAARHERRRARRDDAAPSHGTEPEAEA
jgi:hypothetical protein